jgi:hypothetical protein
LDRFSVAGFSIAVIEAVIEAVIYALDRPGATTKHTGILALYLASTVAQLDKALAIAVMTGAGCCLIRCLIQCRPSSKI